MSKLEFFTFECFGCPLKYKEDKRVWGYGNYKNKIMFIGEAPGAEEEKLGKPFVGRSGRLLDKMLNEVGLDRELFYITNIIKCRPENNRKPSVREISWCKRSLKLEIAKIKPKLIVTLGSTAINTILPNNSKSMKNIVGKIIKTEIDLYSYLVFPLYHPGHVIRGGITQDEYLNLFLELKKVICKIYLTQYKRLRWLINEICRR